MKKIKTTYKEFYEMSNSRDYYVKTPNGEFTRILDKCKKKSDTYDLSFENGCNITVGDKHSFMNMIGECVTAVEIVPGEKINTTVGGTRCISRDNFKKDQDVYDISIGSPHWYINDDDFGIIHHNTLFGLVCIKAFLDKYEDGIVLYYDTEFGSTPAYIESTGVDPSRIIHSPVKNIEELKFDIVTQLEALDRKDNVFIFIDSIGNIASKKEVDDAKSGNSAADMTRAKSLKSLFRMITPYLTMNEIPCVVINHTYQSMEMFSRVIVSGGTGSEYSSNTILTITKSQEKVGTEIRGYKFTLTVAKSRYVKEKSKIPITVMFEGGIKPYSGLLEIAQETGHVLKPAKGKYQALIDLDKETGELVFGDPVSEKMTHKPEFWDYIIEKSDFDQSIKQRYCLGMGSLIGD